MSVLMKFIIICTSMISSDVFAENIGLIPSALSRGHAEAMMSNTAGTDSLFYNPANLNWQGFSVRLIGVELNSDSDSQKRAMELANQESNSESYALAEIYRKFDSPNPIFIESTARIADVTTPHVAITSFSQISGSSQRVEEDENPYYNMLFQGDFGIAGGFAISVGRFSIGYSQYKLLRMQIASQPTIDQIDIINTATENESLTHETVPFRDFSQFYYGGATGHNYGLLYRFISDENPSSIGIAVLNAGGTKFSGNAPIENSQIEKLESNLREESEEYNIEIDTPDSIPEMINAGVTLGIGNEKSGFVLSCTLERDDINGDTIRHKNAASYEVGIYLPDKLALITSWPLFKNKKETYHMGLMNARFFGGIREGAYSSQGAGLAFHFGYDRKISLVRLDLEAYQTKALSDSSHHLETTGYRAALGLTLIF